MNPLVVLNLGKGDCHKGLPIVTAQLWLEGSRVPVKYVGGLPPAEELPELYQQWRSLYEALYGRLSWRRGGASERIEFETEAVTNVSKAEFHRLCEQLQSSLNQWLNSAGFRNIDQQLRTKLAASEGVRVIIETDDPLLQKLPWHLWRFFEHYGRAEVALSAQEYERVHPVFPRTAKRMRILVVLGHSEGIDIQPDGAMLKQLPDAETQILTEPTRAELDRCLWRESGWDILFFAGHSSSESLDGNGRFLINSTEQLSVGQLKNALKAAIARGLKLAIFNSCDGCGLARALADLNLPQLIVMREPIPDPVAQAFLQNFLRIFSGGEAFYPSVRQAREQLQGLESEFPCASWLPVIYQNPTEVPITWPGVTGRLRPMPPGQAADRPWLQRRRITLRSLVASSLTITLAVMGVRTLGWLQPIELQGYDRLMRARPAEREAPIDPRLLVVEITADDTDEYGYPLRDETLAALLTRLQQHQPRAIGLDLHRAQSWPPGREQLIEQFQRSPQLITVCSFSRGEREIFGYPREFSDHQARHQVGFSDLETDDGLGLGRPIVRRQLLSYDFQQTSSTGPNCTTPYSFSLHLAFHFLQAEGVQPMEPTPERNWQLGDIVFKRLASRTGGYQRLDGQSSQILLNYRFNQRPAKRTNLKAILTGKIDAALIQNRIVLIGVTDPIGNDSLETPFGELPGVWIHAHSVSQLLSAVLDNRTLIWVLPQWGGWQWGDFLWVWAWALLGGFIVWRQRRVLLLGVAICLSTLSLYQICLFILIEGGWMPLVPALLALIGTAVFLAANIPDQVRENLAKLLYRLTAAQRPKTED